MDVCVWSMVIFRWILQHDFMIWMSANNRIRFVLKIVFSIVQTYLKTLNFQIYFVECVSKIRHILSVIHYTIRGAVCFQLTHFLVMIEIIYIFCLIIIIKSEVWTITHCLGLGHETMVCAVCLFVSLWKQFPHITDPLWGELTSHRWIRPSKGQLRGFDYFCASITNVEQTLELPVKWDAMTLMRLYSNEYKLRIILLRRILSKLYSWYKVEFCKDFICIWLHFTCTTCWVYFFFAEQIY